MDDRTSRPHHVANRTPQPMMRKIVHLRWKKRLGPVAIGAKLGMPASTVHAVLTRVKLNRLHHVDVRTGEPVRRYEHPYPGSLIHVDVKKIGNIPDGGGWRYVGRQQGGRNRAATPGAGRSKHRGVLMRHAFVHTVIDDNSRVSYAETHDDETAATAVGVLRRAVAWFADRGVRVERVLSDNGSAYKSHAWRDACAELGITPKKTRPYRPQTNGKVERFHRTLADGWAFSRHYNTEAARRTALPAWLHEYNHHRPHTAIGGKPPISRLTNLPGQYT
jgi:transposase InsO family protein